MRSLIALVALVFALPVYAQPAQDTPDPATQARVRLDGVSGGTGAHVPPEASGGGATVGNGRPNRHHAPTPPDLNQAPPDAAQAQPSSDTKQTLEAENISADAMDVATKARVRTEGLAGGTGAHLPPEANGGATVGDGRPNRHFLP